MGPQKKEICANCMVEIASMTPVFWWRAQVVVVVTAGVVDVVAEAGYGCGLVIMLKWLWYEWWHCSDGGGGGSEWFWHWHSIEVV